MKRMGEHACPEAESQFDPIGVCSLSGAAYPEGD
jgi:hypothetical protein